MGCFWVAMVADPGLAVRDLRRLRGLTKEAFGKVFGVCARTVYTWERGNVPPLVRLALAAYLYDLKPWPGEGA